MEIAEALSQYKDLYFYEHDNYSVIFRSLSWKDYKIFHYLFNVYPAIQADLEDQLWELCVVEHNYPSGINGIDAGIVTNIARLIIYLSGRNLASSSDIQLIQSDLESARNKRDSLEGQIKLAILEAFPSYKLEELDDLSWSKIVDLLACSEYLLKKEFQFNLTEDKPVDDSQRVFDMLNDYSHNKGSGRLDQDITDTESQIKRPPRAES